MTQGGYKKVSTRQKESRLNKNKEVLWQIFILIMENKKWWLLPLFFLLLFLSLFVSLTGNQSILPAIYALF
jgi:hypothetical protein